MGGAVITLQCKVVLRPERFSPWAVLGFHPPLGLENRIMANPYESPNASAGEQADGGPSVIRRRPLSLCVLLMLFTVTVIMAVINLIQEGAASEDSISIRSIFFTCMIAGFSGLSQVPGLLIGGWRWKGSPNCALPLLVASYVIAMTGVGGFALFVAQPEPADSMNSAAHMHIFLFPVLHLGFSVCLYLVAFLFSMVFFVYSRFASRSANVGKHGQPSTNAGAMGELDD